MRIMLVATRHARTAVEEQRRRNRTGALREPQSEGKDGFYASNEDGAAGMSCAAASRNQHVSRWCMAACLSFLQPPAMQHSSIEQLPADQQRVRMAAGMRSTTAAAEKHPTKWPSLMRRIAPVHASSTAFVRRRLHYKQNNQKHNAAARPARRPGDETRTANWRRQWRQMRRYFLTCLRRSSLQVRK